MDAAWRLIVLGAFVLAGCAPPDRGARFGGEIDPCDVAWAEASDEEPTVRSEGILALDDAAYWRQGPLPYWTTAPSPRCADNPRTSASSAQPGVALNITFPAVTWPTRTGEVVVRDGAWPVVIFAHANHDGQCEIFEEYFGLMDHWASWGYIVVSVDGTHLNCQSGTNQNIVDRKDGMLAALQTLEQMNEDADSPFFGHVDGTRVVFAGHSRGGGAAIIGAAEVRQERAIAGIIDFQGVDVTSYGFGNPDIPGPFLGFSASRDVDLNFPYVEPTEEQLIGPYTWVTIIGGIHAWTANRTPTEPDDFPKIEQGEQHDVQEYFSTAFLAHHVGVATREGDAVGRLDASSILYAHDGAEVVDRRISSRGVSLRWGEPGRLATLIDDFPSLDATSVNALGLAYPGSVGLERDENAYSYSSLKEAVLPYTKAISRWLDSGRRGQGVWTVPLGGLSISRGQSIQARIRAGARAPQDVTLGLVFKDGRIERRPLRALIGPEELSDRFVQIVWPMSGVLESQEEVESLRVTVEGGDVFVDDVRVVGP